MVWCARWFPFVSVESHICFTHEMGWFEAKINKNAKSHARKLGWFTVNYSGISTLPARTALYFTYLVNRGPATFGTPSTHANGAGFLSDVAIDDEQCIYCVSGTLSTVVTHPILCFRPTSLVSARKGNDGRARPWWLAWRWVAVTAPSFYGCLSRKLFLLSWFICPDYIRCDFLNRAVWSWPVCGATGFTGNVM